MNRLSAVWLAATGAIAMAAGPAWAQTAPPATPCSGPEHRQLDFWTGDWDLEFTGRDGGVAHATNRITRDEYGSCVIAEHFEQADVGYVGTSVSIYDPQLRTWRQTWVDNGGGVHVLTGGPVTGQNHIFEMRSVDPGPDGAARRMIWENVTADSLTWRWQREASEGRWVDGWVIRYRRRG